MQTFWDRVKNLIGVTTVVDLAKILEVKRSTLSSWVQTDRRPPYAVLMRITKETGVSLEELENGLIQEHEAVAESIVQTKKRIIKQIAELGSDELLVIQCFINYVKIK